jgi:hypothetical protein
VTTERVGGNANTLEELSHVTNVLIVQFAMQRPRKDVKFLANLAFKRTVLGFTAFSERFEQRRHVMPLDVVRGGMTENLLASGTVMAVEMRTVAH